MEKPWSAALLSYAANYYYALPTHSAHVATSQLKTRSKFSRESEPEKHSRLVSAEVRKRHGIERQGIQKGCPSKWRKHNLLPFQFTFIMQLNIYQHVHIHTHTHTHTHTLHSKQGRELIFKETESSITNVNICQIAISTSLSCALLE